jgi:hypothetical protein
MIDRNSGFWKEKRLEKNSNIILFTVIYLFVCSETPHINLLEISGKNILEIFRIFWVISSF